MITNIMVAYLGAALLAGIVAGYSIRKNLVSKQASSVEEKIKKQLEDGRIKAKQVILDAKERATEILEDLKNDERKRKTQIDNIEERLLKKEEMLNKREVDVRDREKLISEDLKKVADVKSEIVDIRENMAEKLEKIAGLSRDDAKNELFKEIESKYSNELAEYVQKMVVHRKDEIEKKAMNIMTTVIQRFARSSAAEFMTTNVDLPDEKFKGKIIGKEGRNIRAFERLSGVEIIIDETSDLIVISSFDPVRRAIAKDAMEKLIKDGRIQPAKIEEKIEEAKQEISSTMDKAGESAAYEVGIYDLPKEVIQLLGRLKYRTSYGQNVLNHSIEVAYFSEMIASELGLDVEVAKRGGLLHDIGKSIDHEISGSHVDIGRKILKKYNIAENVVHAMEAHHEEYPYATPESFVVAAADALSAARPGARRDTIENYLKRLTELENIATQFSGVKNAYAISAGRELRIFVSPEKIDDFGALEMARQIANKIQTELKYPGEIKVAVIREIKAVEYAK